MSTQERFITWTFDCQMLGHALGSDLNTNQPLLYSTYLLTVLITLRFTDRGSLQCSRECEKSASMYAWRTIWIIWLTALLVRVYPALRLPQFDVGFCRFLCIEGHHVQTTCGSRCLFIGSGQGRCPRPLGLSIVTKVFVLSSQGRTVSGEICLLNQPGQTPYQTCPYQTCRDYCDKSVGGRGTGGRDVTV